MSMAPQTSLRRFAANTVSSFLTMLIRISALLWVNQYLLRMIAPEEYSLLPLVASILAVLELAKIAVAGGSARFLIEADSREDSDEVTRIVSSLTPVYLGAALVVGSVGTIVVLRLDSLVSVEPQFMADARLMLSLLLALLCLHLSTVAFTSGFTVRMRFLEQNLIQLGTETLRVALLVSLLFFLEPRALWVTVAMFVASMLQLTIFYAWTAKTIPAIRFRLTHMSAPTVRRLLGFSSWTVVQALTALVQRAMPVLLLNRTASAVDVAVFHVGNLADGQIRRLVVATGVPLGPTLTSKYASEGHGEMADLYYRGGRYFLWFALALAAPLMVFGLPIARLYAGVQYIEAGYVMMLSLATYPFVWASAMYFKTAYSIGQLRGYSLCEIALTCVVVVLLVWFVYVRSGGAVAAAVAVSASAIAVHVVLLWPAGLRLVGGRWKDFFRHTLVRGCLPFLAATGFCFAFQASLIVDTWWEVGVGAASSGILYFTVLLLCLDATDRGLAIKGLDKIFLRAKTETAL